jgi:copper chaperone
VPATLEKGRCDQRLFYCRHTRAMIEMTLPTMTCGHCVATVTRTVQNVDPAAKVEIDLPTHRLRIASDREAQDFAAALTDEGYEPASGP